MRCYLDKRDGSPNWYIYEYDERTGQCRRFSTRTTDRSRAETKLAEHIIRLPQQQIINDATLVKIVLRYYELHGKGRFSAETIKRVLALVVEHEPETRLYAWPIDRQKEFAQKCGRTPSTHRRYMGIVRAAVQWTFDRGEIPTMPPIYKPRARDAAGVRPFTVDELRKLFAAAVNEHERRFLLLCTANAPRPGAVMQLTWDRIDAETHVVDYDVPGREITKKRRARAPLCPTAATYLEAHRSIGPVVQYRGRALKGFKMTFKRLSERASVTGTAYGIRKAVAIWLRRESVHEWDIKGMLGHRIDGETERYAQYRPEYMRGAADAVERLLREICPPWLASYLPVKPASVSREAQVAVVNGDFGARDRDRTCDPHHVKELRLDDFQGLKASNDD
jgi:hypothetical protein